MQSETVSKHYLYLKTADR